MLHTLLVREGGGDPKFVSKAAGRRLVDLVNAEIEEAPAFPGLVLPRGGLSASMTTATAADNQLAILQVALLAIAEEVQGVSELLSSIAGELPPHL